MPPRKRRLLRFVLVVLVMMGGLILSASAATITIINMDGPGEGFNDPAPVAPISGNPGTTLGQQRLYAAQFAANIWADLLRSDVDITVNVAFDSLGGDDRRAVLARARPLGAFRDFPGVPIADTWYPAALANALAGADLDPMRSDIRALVNSDVDGSVALGAVRFYYGFDLNAGMDVDFVSVFAHELGHGLGFLTFLAPSTGAKLAGKNDVYMLHLVRRGVTPPDFPSMTDAQRLIAMTSGPDLRWNGPNAKAASGMLIVGASPEGDVEMFAPQPLQPGSSVAHFSTSLMPDELMEPTYTGPHHEVGLALPLFQDLGWQVQDLCGDILLGQEPCTGTLLDHHATEQLGLPGHAYTFSASTGNRVDLRIDATADTLDPVLILLGPQNELLAIGNDELPCSVDLACGGACPQITGTLPATGNYTLITLIARDAPFTSEEESACTGGSYRATADGTGGMRLIEHAANRTNGMGRNQAAVLSLTDLLAK